MEHTYTTCKKILIWLKYGLSMHHPATPMNQFCEVFYFVFTIAWDKYIELHENLFADSPTMLEHVQMECLWNWISWFRFTKNARVSKN